MDAKFLVLLALAATAYAGPIAVSESDKCSTTCKESSKFKYTPGQTYTYDYSVETLTSMAGASEDVAKMTISSVADVEVLSSCEFSLKLKNTNLRHSDASGKLRTAEGERQFAAAVEASELRFSFQDGAVADVCQATPEDAWVVNFKKGVLSAFQNTMDDLSKGQNTTETDISGECATEYTVPSEGYYSNTIKKTKDISSCQGRHQYNSVLQMTPYHISSDLQNLPLVKTEFSCEQTVEKAGILKTSSCVESHVYRPFSGKGGARTDVTQKLTHKTTTSGVSTRPSGPVARSSLEFDNSASSLNAQAARTEVEAQLSEICAASRFDIRPESPRQFAELVKVMRSLKAKDMQELHKLLKAKVICPDNNKVFKFFVDALPLVSTDASVKLMSQLVTDKDVTGVLAQAWLTSLGFVHTPSAEMLLSVKALIDDDATSEAALLPVSSMVNNYCRGVTSCQEDYAVLSIMASLERNIGYSCDARGDKFSKVLLSLRAIGNAGHASRAVGPINKCLSSDSNPLEIRIAAAEAFRRMPCEAKDTELWTTFENGDLDAELRVAAYLALMRCPTEATMGKMAASLVREENDHVGAFVYSHLTNLKSTSDPHRQEVARAAQNLALDKEFELSALKFSRNFEASLLINKLNTGFGAESNLVWSSESNMPRSVSGNLTVDLFGQAINLVDFGARMEGLEYLVKNLFGPYMPEDAKTEQKKPKAEDVEGSVYGRIFGNELFFMHSNTVKSPLEKMPGSWLDLVIAMSKKQDYAFTQSMQFLDASIVIPTIAGLPLTLDVNGTATMDLVLNGQMDLRKLGSSPRSLNIDGEIRPSAAVELTGSMSLDAQVTKTGLRMRNSLHSSTALKGRVQLQRGQLLNVELDTPQDKMEIFNAGSKFFILHNGQEQEQTMIKENRQDFKLCSGDKMAAVAGIEMCGELSFPNASHAADSPNFPFTGPTSASLTLYKRDSHNSYKIYAKRVENKKASIAQISMNTPGSKVDRAILLDVNLNYPQRTLDATMRTPWKKAAVKGVVINSDKMKSISGSIIMDEKDTYSFTSEVKVDKTKNRMQLSPMIELRRAGSPNVQLNGYVAVMLPYKSVDVDLSLSGVSKMPYTLKTTVSNTKKERSVKAAFSTDGKSKYTIDASSQTAIMGKKAIIATVKSALKVNTPSKQILAVSVNGDYREGKVLKLDTTLDVYRLLKKPANLKVTLLKNAKKAADRYDVDVILKSTAMSGKIDSYTVVKKTGMLTHKSIVTYTIPKVAKNKITFSSKFMDKSKGAFNRYIAKSGWNLAKNPEYNVNMKMDANIKKKAAKLDLDVSYGKNPKDKTKKIEFETTLARKLATWKAAILNFKMKAVAPELKVNVNVLGKHQHTPKMVDSSLNINYGGKGKDVKTALTLRNKSAKLAKMNGKAQLSWPGKTYTLSSALDQKNAKQYSHVVNLKSNTGMKHAISTLYKMPNPTTNAFDTTFALTGMKKTVLSGKANVDPKNFELFGQVTRGKDAYGMKTNAKVFKKAPSAKIELEAFYPARRMTLLVDGGRQKNKYAGRVEAAWDADKDNSSRIVLDGSSYMKKSKNSMSLAGDIGFKSPFESFEDLMAGFKYGADDKQNDFSTKLSWGGKANALTTSMMLQRPFSLDNLKFNAEAKSPFKGFKVVSVDIDHSMTPKINTILAGRWDKDNGKLTIEGENLGDLYNRNIKGSVAFKSTLKGAKDIKLNVAHNDAAGKLNSNAALSLNGKPYSYDVNMAHSQYGWEIKNSGDLILVIPSTQVKSSWKHKSSDKDVKSTMSADWGKNKLLVDVDASQDLMNSGAMEGNLKIATPWKSLKNVEASITHKHGNKIVMNKGIYKLNGKTKAASSLKFSGIPSDFNLIYALESPFLNDIDFSLNHQHGDSSIVNKATLKQNRKLTAATVLKASGEPSKFMVDFDMKSPHTDNIDFTLNHEHSGRVISNRAVLKQNKKTTASSALKVSGEPSKFDVDFGLKTPFTDALDFTLNHEQNDRVMSNKAALKQGKKTTHSSALKVSGEPSQFDVDFDLKTPYTNNLDFSLSHKHNNQLLMNKATLKEGKKVTASSILKASGKPSDFNIDLDLKTPFTKKMDISLVHQHGDGLLVHRADVKQAGKPLASSSLKYSGLPTEHDMEFDLNVPTLDAVSGKLNTKYGSYPVTSLAEIQWAPRSKAVLEGSLNVPSWDDANVDLKLTTPFRKYRNIVFKASNKDDSGEMVSRMNLDYGVRENFDLESRMAFNTYKKMLRLKMRTPFEYVRSMETGFTATGDSTVFDGSADFELSPIVGKLEGNLNWDYSDDLKGNLRLTTPFPEFPFFEMSTASKLNGRLRESFITAEYSPRQTYRLDSRYALELPIFVEATISSPFPEYDNLGLSFQHSHTDSSVVSHGEITYQPSKKIEGNVDVDLSSGIEGSVELKTPFYGFQSNKMIVKHQGNSDGFTSHGEIDVAEQKIVADASFNSGFTTTGEFSFSSPIPGLENVELKVNKKGYSNNIKGGATFTLNGDMSQANFNHKLSASELKSGLMISTPYTQTFKMNVEHSGDLSSFTNKVDVNYGRRYDIDTAVVFDYRHPDISGNALIKARLGGPRNVVRAIFSKNGQLEDLSFSATAAYNRDEVSTNGSWKLLNGIESAVQVKTPFDNFRDLRFALSHTGDVYNFKTESSLNYMDNKNINGKVDLSSDGIRRIRFDAGLNTPFEHMTASHLNFEHDFSEYSQDLSGLATFSNDKLGQGSVQYHKSGDLNNFNADITGKYEGEEVVLSASKSGDLDNFNARVAAKYNGDEASLTATKSGALENFNAQLTGKLAGEEAVLSATNAGNLDSFKSQVSLRYPGEYAALTAEKSGDLDNFSAKLTGECNGDEAVLFASKSGDMRNFNAKVSAKYPGNEASLTAAKSGDLDNFDAELIAKCNYDEAVLSARKSGNIENLDAQVSARYSGKEASLTFTNTGNFNAQLTGKLNGDVATVAAKKSGSLRRFKAQLSGSLNDKEAQIKISKSGDLDNFNAQLTGKLMGDEARMSLSKSGSLEDLTVATSASYNDQEITVNGNIKTVSGIDGSLEVKTPFRGYRNLGARLTHRGEIQDFNTQAAVDYMDGKNVKATVEFAAPSLNSIKLESSLYTTRELIGSNKMTISHKYDSYRNSLNSYGTFNGVLGDMTYQVSKTGGLSDLSVEAKALYNGEEMVSGKMTNAMNTRSLNSFMSLKSAFTPEMELTIDHNGALLNSNTKARGMIGESNKVDLETSLNVQGDVFKGKGAVKYQTENFGSNRAALTIQKEGQLNDFKVIVESKVNNDKYNVEGAMKVDGQITGSLKVNTPVAGFKNVGMNFKHSGNMENFKSNGDITFTDGNKYSAKLDFYRYLLRRIETTLEIRTPIQDYEFTKFEYRHEGEANSFKCYHSLEYGNNKKMTYDLNAALVPHPSLSVDIKTPFYGYEDLMAAASFTNNWPVASISGKINAGNGNVGSVEGNVDFSKDITGALEVKTPFYRYEDMMASASLKNNWPVASFSGKLNAGNGNTGSLAGNIDFKKDFTGSLEVKTPFYRYEDMMASASFKNDWPVASIYAKLNAGNGNTGSVAGNVDFTKDFTGSLEVKTPFYQYEDMMASASFVNNWPVASVSGKVNAGNGIVVSLDGNVDFSKDLTGSLKVSTPIQSFTDIGMSFRHAGGFRNFNSEGRITYMDKQNINGKVQYKPARLYAELMTPFSEAIKMEHKVNNNRKRQYTETSLKYGKEEIKSTLTLISSPNYEMVYTMQSPFNEDFTASFELDTSAPKYKLESSVKMGTNSVSLNGGFDMSRDISGFATLKTPFEGYTNLGMSFKHSGKARKFSCDGKFNYADDKEISGKVNFYNYRQRRVSVSVELKTPFAGMEFTKAEGKFDKRNNRLTVTSSLNYNNGQELDGTVKMTFSPNYDVQLALNTPSKSLRKIRVYAKADLNAPSYMVTGGLNYGYRKSYSTTAKLNLFSVQKLDGSLEVKTPLSGFELTKVEYEHKIEDSTVDGSVSVSYDKNSKVVSADLKSTIKPSVDATLTLKTPVAGYRSVQTTVSYDKSFHKYETSSALTIEGNNMFSMNSGLDYSVEPMKVYTKFSTPTVKDVEIELTHKGDKFNFETTGFMITPFTKKVTAATALNYVAPFDMTFTSSVNSALSGADALKFELKNSDLNGEKRINVLTGWTEGQQVQTDLAYSNAESWYENTMKTELALTTPFTALRSLNVQTEHTKKQEGQEGKVSVDVDGAKVLDVQGQYSNKDKHEATLTFNKPYAMQYTASGLLSEGALDADLFANWNRNDDKSNVRIVTAMTDKSDSSMTDRSLDLSVECSVRKVGVSHAIKASAAKLSTNGRLFWGADDAEAVSYDITVQDSSRRNKEIKDGSIKLGLPTRSLQLQGSSSMSPAAKTLDTTFSWDADRDTDKQVGLKATVTQGKSLRGDVSLSMPSLNKEIRVDGELMLDNGKIILDSKTDISYSSDARKTLTLTSKVHDIADYYTNYNYSVELGVSHPYTNIDVQMKSHIGSSAEKMTAGVSTQYLTARRDTKNLELLAEINKIKKQISLQLVNPMGKFETVGEVVSSSPAHLKMAGRVDDIEVFSGDATIDFDNKVAEVKAACESDKVVFKALYPNSKEFRATVSHNAQTEALIAAKLNTSRLLHSRVHWRPALFNQIKAILEKKAERVMIRTDELVTLINQEIGDEISAKYAAVSSSVSEELTPLVDALERELRSVAFRMTQMSRELNTMWQNSDLDLTVAKALKEKFDAATIEYRRNYAAMIQSLRESLTHMTEFPARERYNAAVKATVAFMTERVYNSLQALNQVSHMAEQKIEEYKQRSEEYSNKIADTVYNATYVNYAMDKLAQFKNFDVTPYTSSLKVPQQYTDAIYYVHDEALAGLTSVWNRPELDNIRGNLNIAYQKGKWVYKYLDVEKSLEENVNHIVVLLKEIVEDELKELSQQTKALYKNPITVWEPEHGEIQADLALPFDWERIDSFPDTTPLVEKYNKVAKEVKVYLPDHTTWENLKESVSALMPAPTVEVEDNIMEQMKKLKPSMKLKLKNKVLKKKWAKKNKGKKNRKSKQ